MVDIQTVSIAVASASVTLAAIYYIWQVRHQTRIRKTDMIMRLHSTGTNDEFWDAYYKVINLQFKDYQDYVKQYGPILTEDNPMHRAFVKVATYYEVIGILLYRKLVDLVTVYDVWGSSNPRMLFEKIKPLALGLRKETGEPILLVGFEYLCDELKRKEPELKKTYKNILPRGAQNSYEETHEMKKREQKLQQSKT